MASLSCGDSSTIPSAPRHGAPLRASPSKASIRSGVVATASAAASAQDVRIVSSLASRTVIAGVSERESNDPEPALEARTWWTLTSNSSVPFSTGQRPSQLRRIARSTHTVRTTPWAPASRGISRIPLGRVLPQGDHRPRVPAAGSRALHHSEGTQRQHGRAGVIGQYARVPCRPARGELWPVEQRRDDQGRTDGTCELRHVVDPGEVLAHEEHNRDPVADIGELDRSAGDLHRLPPPDVGVKRAAQVILVDLCLVERPSVVLVLADVPPLFAG